MIAWEQQLLDIWKTHSRINLEILGTIEAADLGKRLDHYETSDCKLGSLWVWL